MSSFEARFYLGEAGRWQRLRRDLRLVAHLLGLAWWWLVVGARVRRDYRAARQAGEMVRLDEMEGGRK
jgi:hypothetical protein